MRIGKLVESEYLIAVLCVVFFAVAAVAVPGFASLLNASNVFMLMLPLMVLATGQSVVVMTAGVDLSIMSVAALCGVCGAMVMSGDGGVLAGSAAAMPVAIAAMVVVGLAAGAFNGVCVAYLKLPPFIVTLISMLLFGGGAVWLTQSRTYHEFPSAFVWFGREWAGALALCLIVAVFAHLILSRTVFGSWIYAMGRNKDAAHVSGVPVRRMLTAVYTFSGLCAALAAVLLVARLESASPVMGKRMLLDVIGATVIGGTSLYGGSGKITWTLLGVCFLSMVDNSLNLLGASFAVAMIAKGGVILFAAIMDAAKRKGERRHA